MSTEPKRTWDPRGGPDPDTKTPRLKVPDGACDCHVHVFGPAARFPFLPSHAERSFEAPREALETMHARICMDRCVIVHVPAHGTDVAVTLDAMRSSAREIRGVALVEPDIPAARLRELDDAGFRGVRYSPTLDGGPLDHDAVRRMADRLAPLGWHILFHFKDNDILPYAGLLESLPLPCVLDHFGGIVPSSGSAGEESVAIVSALLRSGNGWLKTSAIEKVSNEAYPFADAAEIAAAFVALAPDRVLWGSDWPHPGLGGAAPTNDGDLVDLIPTYAPDPALQRRILVNNPARLYGFA